jgi:hypothetical protein
VFYGYREYTAADGAPLTVRVYYPSLDGAPDGAPPLLPADHVLPRQLPG